MNLRRHRGGTLGWLPTQLPAPVRPNRAHRWRRARRPRTAPSSMSRAAASATTRPGPARLRAPPHPLPPISPRAGRAPPDRGRAARTGARILPRPGRGCHTPPRHRHLGPAPARRRTAPGRPRKHLPRPCQIQGHFLAALAKEAPLSSSLARPALSHAQVQKPYTHLANPYERPYVECDGP